MIPVKLTSMLTAAALAAAAAPAALASDIRPTGYLERGTLQATPEGPAFVPDSAAEAAGGRYMRVGGFDETVFYGVGNHPNLDWLWPNHRASAHLKEILRTSPGSLSHLDRYEAGQEYAQNWARMGMLIALGAGLAAAGGVVYGALPSNPREMAPSYYYATCGLAGLGALMVGTSTFIANDNQAILDRAIASYNRDMAGRRKTPAPTLLP